MLRNVHEKRLIPDFMENTIAPFIGFHGLCLQQERGMEQDSYHSERSHCLSDMRRQCVGVLGLEACEAQGPVNTTSPSLLCHTEGSLLL